MNRQISIHHVGGRGGHGHFPVNEKFQTDLTFTYYEADSDCFEQIKERNRHLKSKVQVLPYCIGASARKELLNINYDAFTSSLLRVNRSYSDYRIITNYGAFGVDFDYVLGDVMKTMQRRNVRVIPLDNVQFAGPEPDVLSLDTQGSEYDILRGAVKTMRKAVLAVCTEVEFHPIYEGQKLFGDINDLLTKQGFRFIGFIGGVQRFMPMDSAITLRGEGVQLNEDALFLRTVDGVKAMFLSPRKAALMYYKLAFIAITFNQVEFAAEYLIHANFIDSSGEVRSRLANTKYMQFLDEFDSAIIQQPPYFPVRFCEVFTQNEAMARFSPAKERGTEWLERVRDWCVRKDARWILLKRLLHPLSANARRVTLLLKLIRKLKPFWRHPAFQWRTQTERVLSRYGFTKQSKIIRRNRLRHAPFCK